MKRLAGKHCVITGAARGIGLAIAERFIAEGGQVLLTDRNVREGRESAQRLGCEFLELDVRRGEDWARMEKHVPEVDVMVNNAGVTGLEEGVRAHDPEHATLADWRAVHEVNLDGTFLGCRFAIGAMKASGQGSIINISRDRGLSVSLLPPPTPHRRQPSATTPRQWHSTARSRDGRSAVTQSIRRRS